MYPFYLGIDLFLNVESPLPFWVQIGCNWIDTGWTQ